MYHHERVANPQGLPCLWARGDLDGLAVHGNHHSRGLADSTPANTKTQISVSAFIKLNGKKYAVSGFYVF